MFLFEVENLITVTQNDKLYEIRSRYDPELIKIIKDVPGRKWVPENKIWTIPLNSLGWFLEDVKGTVYEKDIQIISEEHIDENEKLDTTSQIPDIDISKIPFYVVKGSKPFKHQTDCMKYAIYRQQRGNMSGFILADEPGAGKSLEICNIALYNKKQYNFKHCLIICCINTSKYNWYNDIVKHTNGEIEPYILGTRLRRDKVTTRSDTGTKEKLQDLKTGHMYGDKTKPKLPYFIILNIEALRAREGKYHTITEEIIKMYSSGQLQMIAIDEIHKNASPSSIQGKQLINIKKKCPNIMWIPLTGTPIVNKPTDVYLPLKLVNGHDFSSFRLWCQQFCLYGGFGDHDIVGYKNISKLKKMLQSNMLRRLKKDFIDLPPKVYYDEYVENTAYQKSLYQKVATDIISQKDNILRGLNPLSQFMRLRQVNDAPEIVDRDLQVDNKYLSKNAKFVRILELLEEIASHGEKTLIFSNWVEPLRTLYRFVSKKYDVCVCTGTMPTEEREKQKHTFMNDPQYTVMIGTIGAMGTSHTLNAANNVIFLDEPWTATDKTQAEDRVHRPGTTQIVKIYTIITKDTVDDRVHQIVYGKDQIAGYIVDNKIDIYKNPELFDLILRDTKV